MKRLFLFFTLIAFSVYNFNLFSIDKTPIEQSHSEESISMMKEEAQSLKSSLEKQQEELKKQAENQSKKVENAPEEERQKEQETLDKINTSLSTLSEDANSLEQFISNQNVTQEDAQQAKQNLDKTDEDIKAAQELSEQLQSEFVEQQATTEKEIEEKAQAGQQEIEKSSSWQTFKQIAGKLFTELKLTFATFFGSTDTIIAIRSDLNAIYDGLKDYTSKQSNLKELASAYADLGNISEAMKYQQLRLDTVQKEVESMGLTETYKDRQTEIIVTDMISNILAFKEVLAKNKLLFLTENIQNINSVNEKINNLLGQIGLNFQESYYSTLGVSNTATLQEIKEARNAFGKAWGRTDISTEQWENIKHAYDIIGTNIPELLTSLGLSPNATTQEITTASNAIQEEWNKAKTVWSNTPVSQFGSEKAKGEAYNTLKNNYSDKIEAFKKILAKIEYDNTPLAKKGYEITSMTTDEREEFKNQRSQQQSNILSNGGL